MSRKTAELGYIDYLNFQGRTALSLAGSHSNESAGLQILRDGGNVNVTSYALDHVDVDTGSESA